MHRRWNNRPLDALERSACRFPLLKCDWLRWSSISPTADLWRDITPVLPNFEGWQEIRILSPNEVKSDQVSSKGTCLKETPSQNNSPNAAGRLNGPATPVGEPSPTARGQFIDCPVKERRTEVTTPLPQPWWKTPQIGKLERVSVQTIGGNRTLVCEYWAYGRSVSIMRAFPEGATDCLAEGKDTGRSAQGCGR